jgi:hypothetical protein
MVKGGVIGEPGFPIKKKLKSFFMNRIKISKTIIKYQSLKQSEKKLKRKCCQVFTYQRN